MAQPINWDPLRGFKPDSIPASEATEEPKPLVTLECSAVSGFETAVAAEVNDRFGIPLDDIVKAQGRVVFDLPIDIAPKVSVISRKKRDSHPRDYLLFFFTPGP